MIPTSLLVGGSLGLPDNNFMSGIKIFYIANARMPTEKAHGIQLAKMCEAFMEAGANLELIVPRRKIAARDMQDFYGLRCKIPLKSLPVLDMYSAGRLGFLIGSCSFTLSYFFYLLYARFLYPRAVIYTIDMDQFSFFLVPFLGLPYFVEIHDAKERGLAFSILFRNAKGIIVINRRIQKALIKNFGIPEKNIMMYPNGIDLTLFHRAFSKNEARKILGLSSEKRLAVYVGKIYPWKGLDILVKAASKIGEALIYIVGGSKEEFTALLENPAIPPNIICVGDKNYQEIPLWLAAADALLVLGTQKNDYSYYHTSPMKLFEYMASGRPILASNTPANREIVSDKEAWFYRPDNSDDLAEKFLSLFSDLEKSKAKADEATDKVKQFTWQLRANNVLQFMKIL